MASGIYHASHQETYFAARYVEYFETCVASFRRKEWNRGRAIDRFKRIRDALFEICCARIGDAYVTERRTRKNRSHHRQVGPGSDVWWCEDGIHRDRLHSSA